LAGVATAAPQWPPGISHRDEHFGDVVVYFDPVEVSVPLQRQHGDGGAATLVATFQGCQDEGICYPPMTRRIALSLPTGTATSAAAAPVPASPLVEPLPGARIGDAVDADGVVAGAEAGPADESGPSSPLPADASGAGADITAENALRSQPPILPGGGLAGA